MHRASEGEIVPPYVPDPHPRCLLYPCAMHPEGRLHFTDEEAETIRRYWYGGFTIVELAESFGAHRNTISRIVNGDTHAGPPTVEAEVIRG